MSDSEIDLAAEKTVFVSGNRSCTARNVIDAACFRGELEPVWHDLLRLTAAEAKANEQDLEPDDAAIEAAAEQFRYAHDLITAEETERWLAEHDLTLADFSAWVLRRHWGEQMSEIEAPAIDYLTASPELREQLRQELIFSGDLDRMAVSLSRRVAAACASEDRAPEAESVAKEEESFLERTGLERSEIPAWLARLGLTEEWLREALTMEAIYRETCREVLSREACEREIAALRVPLTRFEVETIELDSLDAAREALLCARDDGMSMEEVAAEGRYPYRRPEVLLEEIPEELQQRFLSVHPGDLLGPIPRGDAFQVCRIVQKAEPNLDDPVVRERAETRILERHFGELTTRHIQWRLLLPA